ncbi:MAG: CinA family protein [Sphingomonadales bacterium]|nr:CinA family protein [Sphingomonadales bacterium]
MSVTTAESCTGGLIASLLTDIDGLGACFDRGFVTYTERAKSDLLGIEPIELRRHGAVSAETARAMAAGALDRSHADIAIAVTGFAGPAGPKDEEGLVHLACARREGPAILRECHFGPLGRDRVRQLAARGALEILEEVLDAEA